MNRYQSRINWLAELAVDEGIRLNEMRLAAILAAYPTDDISPGLDELAANAGMHKATVIRALKMLEERGALWREKGGGRGHKTQWYLGWNV